MCVYINRICINISIYIYVYIYNYIYHIISYYIISNHIYYIILCYVILYYIILYHDILLYFILYYTICYVLLYYIILYYIILYYTILYYVMLCCVELCYGVLYCIILHYIMLYYVILYYIILYHISFICACIYALYIILYIIDVIYQSQTLVNLVVNQLGQVWGTTLCSWQKNAIKPDSWSPFSCCEIHHHSWIPTHNTQYNGDWSLVPWLGHKSYQTLRNWVYELFISRHFTDLLWSCFSTSIVWSEVLHPSMAMFAIQVVIWHRSIWWSAEVRHGSTWDFSPSCSTDILSLGLWMIPGIWYLALSKNWVPKIRFENPSSSPFWTTWTPRLEMKVFQVVDFSIMKKWLWQASVGVLRSGLDPQMASLFVFH